MENNNNQPPTSSYSQPPTSSYSQPPPPYYSQPLPSFYSQPPTTPYSQQVRNNLFNDIASISDLKSHRNPLPVTKIKKIMKYDPDVEMVTGEATMVLSKACEMFIVDLTMRSWFHAQSDKRRTLKRSHFSAVVFRNFPFDFLLEVVPRDESVTAVVARPNPYGVEMPYCYLPHGMVMGTPVVNNSGGYAPPQQALPGAWTAAAGDGEDMASAGEGEDMAAAGEGEDMAAAGEGEETLN